MSTASSATRELARRLFAHEAARPHRPAGTSDAARVCEELHARLSKLMGAVGFASLLSRALALARAEAPSLEAVRVRADGTLEGFDQDGQDQDAGTAAERGVVLVANLLELLVTFIGAPLTLRLLRDAWPAAPINEIDLKGEEKP